MWNSTTAVDKKTKEDVADSAAADIASSDCGKNLNIFDNGRKTQTSDFGSNFADSEDHEVVRKKEKEVTEVETIDSGFTSGPQTSSNLIYEDELRAEGVASQSAVPKEFNILEEEKKSDPNSSCIAAAYENDKERRITVEKSSDLNLKMDAIRPDDGNTTTTTLANNFWKQFYQQNDDGDTALHLACISGFVEVVAALIRIAPHPCLFDLQNDEAQTALHLAARTAQPKIIRKLVIAGATPTIRDCHGNTALHLACISGMDQCVRTLLVSIMASETGDSNYRRNDKAVSYLEICNYDGERCVHLAAQAGHIGILRTLVLYGADINAREGKSGRTPLHIAIESCNVDLDNFLLDECRTVNLETVTYGGLTAYQFATILKKSEMQDVLEKHGAETLTPPDSDCESSDSESSDCECWLTLDDAKVSSEA